MTLIEATTYLESERSAIEATLAVAGTGCKRRVDARNALVALSLAAMDNTMHVMGISSVEGSANIQAWIVDAATAWKACQK
jgi:hypothetical protein